MKKILLAVGILSLQQSIAQTVVNFEDLTVPGADSAWLGSTGEGGFTSHGAYFNNTYTTSQWGDYWGGFIYSNSTDNTTAGYTNDYSAFTGVGANNSSNYAVYYGGTIDLSSEKGVGSIAITNTTYAALSMLNGDAYGKQFGSPNNAAGNPDGTNGADWFRLLIIGANAQGSPVDTVVFYLADYRFTNNQDDYIVSTWETVDISSLGAVRYLEFVLESSDVGGFGMNTPAYFALDNLTYGTLGVADSESITFSMYPNPATNVLNIQSEPGEVKIYSTTGNLLVSQTTEGFATFDIAHLASGTYIIEMTTENGTGRSTFLKN